MRRQEVAVEVDFYGFCLQEAQDEYAPVAYPDGRAGIGEPLVTALPGRLDIESGGHTQEAADDASLFSQSRELRIRAVAGGPVEDRLVLGAADMAGARVLRRTGPVARLAQLGVPKGVERHLVEFRPAR
ncbi:hypothetical protein [Streptomyces sp. NPDC001070]